MIETNTSKQAGLHLRHIGNILVWFSDLFFTIEAQKTQKKSKSPSPEGEGFNRFLRVTTAEAILTRLSLGSLDHHPEAPLALAIGYILGSLHPSHCQSLRQNTRGPKHGAPNRLCGYAETPAATSETFSL
jgi:hypothetical protein